MDPSPRAIFETSWSSWWLETKYKSDNDCLGLITVQQCQFLPATVQCPVAINGNESIITLDPKSSIFDYIVVGDVADPDTFQYPDGYDAGSTSLYGGYWLALESRFNGNASLQSQGVGGSWMTSTGATPPQFAAGTYGCAVYFNDPTEKMLAQARELIFRTALAFGNGSTAQTISGTQVGNTNKYRVRHGFLVAAVVLTSLTLMAALATLNGFWTLGRDVSMSPVETAKAFNAPMLLAEHSYAETGDIVKSVGAKHVRYYPTSGGIRAVREDHDNQLVSTTTETDVVDDTNVQMVETRHTA